jgi:hypothetical protein
MLRTAGCAPASATYAADRSAARRRDQRFQPTLHTCSGAADERETLARAMEDRACFRGGDAAGNLIRIDARVEVRRLAAVRKSNVLCSPEL